MRTVPGWLAGWLTGSGTLVDEGRDLRNNAADPLAADGYSFWLAEDHQRSARSIAGDPPPVARRPGEG